MSHTQTVTTFKINLRLSYCVMCIAGLISSLFQRVVPNLYFILIHITLVIHFLNWGEEGTVAELSYKEPALPFCLNDVSDTPRRVA